MKIPFTTPLLLFCCYLLLLNGCTSNTEQSKASATDALQADPPKQRYTLLRHSELGNFKNIDILIDSTQLESSDILITSTAAKSVECRDLPCNVISIWSSKRALELYENKSDSHQWRKKNWPYLCEHFVADYNVTVNELNLYPFLDDTYRQWGGKKKRLKPSSFTMPQ